MRRNKKPSIKENSIKHYQNYKIPSNKMLNTKLNNKNYKSKIKA